MTARQPTILALETSGTVCSVALAEGAALIAEYTLEVPNIHDRMLATLVQRSFADSGCTVTSLHAIAVSAGPGSFTGLRIGFAFAKGMCFGTSARFLAVPTLEACAYAAAAVGRLLPDCDIAALIHAHDELFFIQHFSNSGEPLTEALLLPAPEIESRIAPNTLLCGPGASHFRQGLHIPGLQRLTARFIARYALQLYRTERWSDPSTATPLYIEPFVPRAAQSAS